MFAIGEKLILFLKGFKAQSGYYLMGDPPRWHKWDKNNKAPKAAHHVVDHTAHSKAVEALQKIHHSTHAKSAAEMVGEVVIMGKKLADERNALRRLGEVKRDLLAGKKPSAGAVEWFWQAPKEKRDAAIAEVLRSRKPESVRLVDDMIQHAPAGAMDAADGQVSLFGDDPVVAAGAGGDAGHAEGDKWVQPLDAAIQEHQELVQVATTPTKVDDKVETEQQKVELGRMEAARAEGGQQPAPAAEAEPRIVFPVATTPAPAAEPQPLPTHPATRVLTEGERNDIRRSSELFDKYGRKAEGGRAAWREDVMSGKMDNLWEEHLANVKAVEERAKAARKAKNDAWRDKNLPRLRANKAAEIRAQQEARARADEFERKVAEAQAAAQEKLRAQMEQDRRVEAAAQAKKEADEAAARANQPLELPKSGRVSEDDPSIYGSWLLGREGALWSDVRKLAPSSEKVESSAKSPAAAPKKPSTVGRFWGTKYAPTPVPAPASGEAAVSSKPIVFLPPSRPVVGAAKDAAKAASDAAKAASDAAKKVDDAQSELEKKLQEYDEKEAARYAKERYNLLTQGLPEKEVTAHWKNQEKISRDRASSIKAQIQSAKDKGDRIKVLRLESERRDALREANGHKMRALAPKGS